MPAELLGWAAGALVLAASCMRGMVGLRVMAIASNLAFIGYGFAAGIEPVWVLHLLLLPVNLRRLAELRPGVPPDARVAGGRAGRS